MVSLPNVGVSLYLHDRQSYLQYRDQRRRIIPTVELYEELPINGFNDA